MKWQLFLSCCVVIMMACNAGGDEKKNSADSTASSSTAGLHALRGKIDSVQVIYYDDPDGDSLRYTRYFTYSTTADSALISGIVSDIRQITDTLTGPRQCRSEGKMYVFAGKPDEPVKTLYFSTRCDTCCYLYYIQNGMFYYSGISESSAQKIKQLKASAVQP
ncbi:MAG: hypothetical protein ACTHLE_17425 [Agriterribacter sp.]